LELAVHGDGSVSCGAAGESKCAQEKSLTLVAWRATFAMMCGGKDQNESMMSTESCANMKL